MELRRIALLLHVTATVVEAAAVAQVKTIQQQPVEPHHLQGKDLQVAVERELRDLAAVARVKLAKQMVAVMAVMEKQVPLQAQVLLVAVAVAVAEETIFQYR